MDDRELSLEELRESLLEEFADSGVLSSLKAQLRRHFLDSVQNVPVAEDPKSLDVSGAAVSSLVLEHMKSQKLTHSTAVFLPESGLSKSTSYSAAEALRILGYSSESKLFKAVEKQSDQSVLEVLLRSSQAEQRSQTTQTTITPEDHLRAQLRSLEQRFQHVSDEADKENLETKLSAHMRQMDERAAQEAKEMFQRWQRQELLKVEMELRAQKTREIDQMRRELQSDYSTRLDVISRREEERVKRAESDVRNMEAASYDHRQRLMMELERLQNREAESKRLMDAERLQLDRERRDNKDLEIRLQEREAVLNRKELEIGLRAAEAAKAAKVEATREYERKSDAITAERRFLEQQREALEAERSTVQMQLQKHLEGQRDLTNKEAEVVSLEEKVREMEVQLEQQRRVIAETQGELQAKEDDALAAVAAAAKLPLTFSGIGADLDPRKLTPLMVSKLSLVALRAQSEQRCEELKVEVASLNEELRKLRDQQVDELQDLVQQKQKEWQRAETLKARSDHLEAELLRAQGDTDRAVVDSEELRLEAQSLRSENVRLTGMIEHLKQMMTDSKIQHSRRSKAEREDRDARGSLRPEESDGSSQAYRVMKKQVREDMKARKVAPKQPGDMDDVDDREVAPTKTTMHVLERILQGVQGLAAKAEKEPHPRPAQMTDSDSGIATKRSAHLSRAPGGPTKTSSPPRPPVSASKTMPPPSERKGKDDLLLNDAAALVRQARQEAELFRKQSEVTLHEVRMRSAAIRDWDELVRERLKLAQDDVNMRSRLSMSLQEGFRGSLDTGSGHFDMPTASEDELQMTSGSLGALPRYLEARTMPRSALGMQRPLRTEQSQYPRDTTESEGTFEDADDARIARAEQEVEELKRKLQMEQEEQKRLEKALKHSQQAQHEVSVPLDVRPHGTGSEPDLLDDDEKTPGVHVEKEDAEVEVEVEAKPQQGTQVGHGEDEGLSKEHSTGPHLGESVFAAVAVGEAPHARKILDESSPGEGAAPLERGAAESTDAAAEERASQSKDASLATELGRPSSEKLTLPDTAPKTLEKEEESRQKETVPAGEVSSRGSQSEAGGARPHPLQQAEQQPKAENPEAIVKDEAQLESKEAAEEAARRQKEQAEEEAKERHRREEELRKQQEQEDAGLRELREQRERVRLRRRQAREDEQQRLQEEQKRKEEEERRVREQQAADEDEDELELSTGTKSGSNEYDESGSTTSGYF